MSTPRVTVSQSNTPLSAEELADLIPNLSTKEELNEWERENILEAREWALKDRTTPTEILRDDYIRKLHLRMFDQTWKWAGHYRKTEKNLGLPVHQIREQLGLLLADAKCWIENKTYSPDEIAIRFHYRLVVIHPLPNGNGRHARLMADSLAVKLGAEPFTWGVKDFVAAGEARAEYLKAMRQADAGDIKPLLEFARS